MASAPQVDVAGTAVQLPINADDRPLIWNEGPDRLWIARKETDATAGTGFPIASGTGYEYLNDIRGELWAVSEGASDVRILVVG